MPRTGIADLPYELLERVLDDALQGQSHNEARSTCLKLCTTAKFFVPVAQARLYRNVNLVFNASSSRSRDFKETIERNEALAGHVRALRITVRASAGPMWASTCQTIVGLCIRIRTIRYAPESPVRGEAQTMVAMWDGCTTLRDFTLVLHWFGQLVTLPTKCLETLTLQFAYGDLPSTRFPLPSSPVKPLNITTLRIQNLCPTYRRNCEEVVSHMLATVLDTIIRPPQKLKLHECRISMRSWRALMSKMASDVKDLHLSACRFWEVLGPNSPNYLVFVPRNASAADINRLPYITTFREKGVNVKIT
jgi:hypothetical protein